MKTENQNIEKTDKTAAAPDMDGMPESSIAEGTSGKATATAKGASDKAADKTIANAEGSSAKTAVLVSDAASDSTLEAKELYVEKPCRQFTEILAGSSPVPGGGSVSALVGALGTALGNMVGSLTVGKKKYADVEQEMLLYMAEAQTLRRELLDLVQQDIDIFQPLSALYGMKAETPREQTEKEALMEQALLDASMVPLHIMEKCGRAIELADFFAQKGSRLAVSDAGASAILCKSAMQAASLNVYINTNSMKDRDRAEQLNKRSAELLEKYTAMGDKVFQSVFDGLQK